MLVTLSNPAKYATIFMLIVVLILSSMIDWHRVKCYCLKVKKTLTE